MANLNENGEFKGQIITASILQTVDQETGETRVTAVLKPGVPRIDSITGSQMGEDISSVFLSATEKYGPIDYCFDLRDVCYLSSSGLREMALLLKRLRRTEKSLVNPGDQPTNPHNIYVILNNAKSNVGAAFCLSGLDTEFCLLEEPPEFIPALFHPI